MSTTVAKTKEYYDGPADEIYRQIWQDNIHMGTWETGEEDFNTAQEKTNIIMAQKAGIKKGDKVLDAGCGYGATARYLARTFECNIIGINISEKELELANQRTREQGLDNLCTFEYGDFHRLGYPDESFDVVWSQEAFLHGEDKRKILEECFRVAKKGGKLVFSDIVMIKKNATPEDESRIHERLQTTDIWDFDDYRKTLKDIGFNVMVDEEWSEKVAPSYHAVATGLRNNRAQIESRVGAEVIDRTLAALDFWVAAAKDNKIGQIFIVAEKPVD